MRYTKDKDGILLRHVNRIQAVFEMTIASDPAYTQTSVTAREIESTGIKLRERTSVSTIGRKVEEIDRIKREVILNTCNIL